MVNKIIRRFTDKVALVIYLSNHGEEVYNKQEFVGHSDSKPSPSMVEVPFVVYMSDSFMKQHLEVVLKIQNAQDKPLMSDDFIHALLDLLEIQSKDFEKTCSLFSTEYNERRQRIYGYGSINYADEVKKRSK